MPRDAATASEEGTWRCRTKVESPDLPLKMWTWVRSECRGYLEFTPATWGFGAWEVQSLAACSLKILEKGAIAPLNMT